MNELVAHAGVNKLASARSEAIIATIKGLGKRAKDTAKGKKWTGAEKHLADLNKVKQNPRVTVDTRGAEKALAAAKSERIAQGKKVGAGIAAAGIGAMALRSALKRGGSKGIASLTKKQKLIKMMKKNPKATAAAGVGGGVGLAALLSK